MDIGGKGEQGTVATAGSLREARPRQVRHSPADAAQAFANATQTLVDHPHRDPPTPNWQAIASPWWPS
jgi:hypothetical protein